MAAWVVATDAKGLAASIAAARPAAPVTVLAVGPRELADQAAAAGPDEVRWLAPTHDVPAEASGSQVADLVVDASPRLLVTTAAPAARALAGSAAARLGASVVPAVTAVRIDGEVLIVERIAIGGAATETLAARGPVAAILAPSDEAPVDGAVASVDQLTPRDPAPLRFARREPRGRASSVRDAARVVSVGRGLRARDDLALVERLAVAMKAELACSMPIADDLCWMDTDRYVGRSGQHISPRLYLAVGVSGTPQHLDGVRGAKVVAAVNSDPQAPIFRDADYGIVGDLYEVVPALIAALGE